MVLKKIKLQMIMIIFCLSSVMYLDCSDKQGKSEPSAKSTEVKSIIDDKSKTKREKEIAQRVKEADIVLPDIAEIIASYAAPKVITLHFPENLTGKIDLIYGMSIKDKKILDDLFAQYPKLKSERIKFPAKKGQVDVSFIPYLGEIHFLHRIKEMPLQPIMHIPMAKTFELRKMPFALIIIHDLNDKEKGSFGLTVFELGRTNLISEDKTKRLNYSISLIRDLKSECNAPGETIITQAHDTNPKMGLCLKQI